MTKLENRLKCNATMERLCMKACRRAREICDQVLGDRETTTGEEIAELTLLTLVIPVLFRAKRDLLLAGDESAIEFNKHIEEHFRVEALDGEDAGMVGFQDTYISDSGDN